jgi:hypothetical protein
MGRCRARLEEIPRIPPFRAPVVGQWELLKPLKGAEGTESAVPRGSLRSR